MMDRWTLFELAVNVFQGYLIMYFMKNRTVLRHTSWYADLICTLTIGLFFSLHTLLDWEFNDAIVFIIPFLYALCISDDKWYVSLFWTIVLATLFLATINVTFAIYMSIPDVTLENLMSSEPWRVAFVVSCNVALLIITFAVSKIKFGKHQMSWLSLSIFLISNLLYLLVVELLFTIRLHISSESDSIFTIVCLCLFGCSIMSLVLFETMSRYVDKQTQYKLELETVKLANQHQDELRDVYTNLVAYQHDIKHQMQAIEQMVASGNSDDAKQYFESFAQSNVLVTAYATGSTAIDALLTAKTMLMNRSRVAFEFVPYPLHELPISEYEFCAIVGNILDNAIDAISRIDGSAQAGKISLSFSRSWDMFYIVCKNDMNPGSVRKSGGLFISAKKKDASRYGVGTQNVTRIVEKADGRVKFKVTDDTFRVEIILPYIKKGVVDCVE